MHKIDKTKPQKAHEVFLCFTSGGAVQLSPEGSRATCSGLKTHGEIPLGFSETHKQCLSI